MIILSDNIVEAQAQIDEGKRLTARPVGGKTIPNKAGLTGLQAYLQFCYRMAKFDQEFATPDPVVGQSWLNTAMTRFLHEIEKRLQNDYLDRAANPVFGSYLRERSFMRTDFNPNQGTAVWSPPYGGANKILLEPPHAFIKLIATPDYPNTEPQLKWWPSENDGGLWRFSTILADTIEVEESELKRINFLTTDSFNDLEAGVHSKVYFHRNAGGKTFTTWQTNVLRDVQGNSLGNVPPMTGIRYAFSITVEEFHSYIYDMDEIIADKFVNSEEMTQPLPIPIEFHNDLIDYAIDAYFESMFFHQFGKYSMKQARQDDDSVKVKNVNRTQKLDAVPPQRYRLGQ